MEKISPKIAAAFGVGFIGFILAAYSYNKHHKPDYADSLYNELDDEEKTTTQNNEQNVEQSVEQNNEQNVEKNNNQSVEQEVKNEIDKTGWAQFWKEEYTDIKNNKQNKQSNNKQSNNKQSNNKQSKQSKQSNNKQSKQSNKNIQRMQTV